MRKRIESGPKCLFIASALLALVLSIATALHFLSSKSNFDSKKMTSACAHNPASHLRTRPDRDVLPTNVQPMLYDLVITPDMDNFTFVGQVSIE